LSRERPVPNNQEWGRSRKENTPHAGRRDAESPGQSLAATLELAEAWLTANGEVMARWMDVTRLLVDTQARGHADFSQLIARARETRV
jgi:hypothetical protein